MGGIRGTPERGDSAAGPKREASVGGLHRQQPIGAVHELLTDVCVFKILRVEVFEDGSNVQQWPRRRRGLFNSPIRVTDQIAKVPKLLAVLVSRYPDVGEFGLWVPILE